MTLYEIILTIHKKTRNNQTMLIRWDLWECIDPNPALNELRLSTWMIVLPSREEELYNQCWIFYSDRRYIYSSYRLAYFLPKKDYIDF